MSKKIRNKIDQDVYFVKNSINKVPRSTFYRNQDIKTTFNAGKLIPIFVDEVLPGDTRSIDLASVIRVNSPFIKPVMDDIEFVSYAFFVPTRLCDDRWEQVIGGFQSDPDWVHDNNIPGRTLIASLSEKARSCFALGSVADYMGLPVNTDLFDTSHKTEEICAYPFTAYALIWNNWFRDEALQKSISVNLHDRQQEIAELSDLDWTTSAAIGGALAPLNKIHDYFTSALPNTQKGSAVQIGIGGVAPVQWGTSLTGAKQVMIDVGTASASENYIGIGTDNGSHFVRVKGTLGQAPNLYGSPVGTISQHGAIYANLSTATAIPINDLRYAFQLQLIKEADARGGTRYKEYLQSHFGVLSADSRLQIPEYLGSYKMDLNVSQVVQTSASPASSDSGTFQANTAAYSLTSMTKHVFTKSFTEHGYIMIVGGCRVKHRTYSQGINKMWSRKSRFDWYLPELQNIGEQPIKNKEIYFNMDGGNPDQVFGYQEAWADYRYLPSKCTGLMRADVPETLAYYNFSDNYSTLPTLSPSWIAEDKSNIDRTLAIPSETTPQFIADFYVKDRATRPMPVHSIPGLIDHSGKIIL